MLLVQNFAKRSLAGFVIFACATLPLASSAYAQSEPYFGIDSSEFANDGECDDVRFSGEGMSEALLTEMIGNDASDCRKAFKAGTVHSNPLFTEPNSPDDINYGDDKGDYANDGECDDIRFWHSSSQETIYLVEDIGHDASDCKAMMAKGSARWQANDPDIELGLNIIELMGASNSDEMI